MSLSQVWKNTALMKDSDIKVRPHGICQAPRGDPRMAVGIKRHTSNPCAFSLALRLQALKEQYFEELNNKKAAAAEETDTKNVDAGSSEAKSKPKLKKKVGADDPFASDDEDKPDPGAKKSGKGSSAAASAPKGKAVQKKPAPKKKPAADVFESDDDAEEAERKAKLKALKAGSARNAATRKRKASEIEDETAGKKRRRP